MEYADLILKNGKIVTLDPDNNTAEALAIRDGKILKVDTDDEVSLLIGPDTEIVDFETNIRAFELGKNAFMTRAKE